MNTKCNMCLAAIAIAISVGVVATLLPTRSFISQIYQYKKIDLKYLYSYQTDERPQFERNGKLNAQYIWENNEKIEIKGKLYFDANRLSFSIADEDYRSDGRRNNLYQAYLIIRQNDRQIAKKLLEAAHDCENFVLANNGRLDYIKGVTYVSVKGYLSGNFPYEFKNKKEEMIRFWNQNFFIEVNDVETCLTKEEYDKR